ncbi:Separase-like protein [Drosera capensis]
MEEPSINGDSIIANFSSSNFTNLHSLVSHHLKPLTQNPNPNPSIRALAKSYLPFLNQALSMIPKTLSETPKREEVERWEEELFGAYRVCLDGLEVISSELAAKVCTVYSHRGRLIGCLVYWGRCEEGWGEGVRVLRGLKVGEGGEGWLTMVEGRGDVEAELGYLVVDVVVMMVQCVAMGKSEEEGRYRDVMSLVEEVKPWFRVLDDSRYVRLQRKLLMSLGKATRFLVKGPHCLEGDLLVKFIVMTFDVYTSFLKDQRAKEIMYKVTTELLDLVSYCAYASSSESSDACIYVAKYLYKLDIAPFSLITRFYALGMLIADTNIRSNPCSKNARNLRLMLDCQGKLQHLSGLFGCKKTCSCAGSNGNYKSLRCKSENTFSWSSSFIELDHVLEACDLERRNIYLSLYLKALKYFCSPLSHFIYLERNTIISEEEGLPMENSLRKFTQDVFLRFCDTFFACHSCTGTGERQCFQEALGVFLASFILSLKRRHDKKSVNFMKRLIDDKCIQPQELKFLIARLNNIGVDCQRSGQLEKASKAIKLCCKASWILLCQMLINEQNSCNKLPDVIEDLLNEASGKSALLLDILFQVDADKIGKVVEDMLEQWSVAICLFTKLPCPVTLVKQWVKIQIKSSYRSLEVEADEHLLFTHLSNTSASREAYGAILEQELTAYQEMNASFPRFCQMMERRIIDMLLDNVYVTKHSWIQRADCLIQKARILRACGVECLKECIWCLSEAIKTMRSHGETKMVSHKLAVAHCVRALCTYEDASDPKHDLGVIDEKDKPLLDDIQAAISIWLSTDLDKSPYGTDIEYQYILFLLYHVFDLLSIKGNMSFHSDIYNLMLKLFKQMHFPAEKCLRMLWESRRLNHALCFSPISDASVLSFSNHFSDAFKSIDHWMKCFSGCKALLFGFQQKFSSLSTYFPDAFHSRKHCLPAVSDMSQGKVVTTQIDKVKEIALQLISDDPVPSRSSFLAGYLFYDLSVGLTSSGQLVEALLWAKESHQQRSKLLLENFQYMIECYKENGDERREDNHKQPYFVSHFQVCSQVAAKAWPCNFVPLDRDCCHLTPWKVLQCYLESTLQVGAIHEMIGNGAEAEALFHIGKTIACKQGLPLFTLAFSSNLGKLYRKKQLYDIAKKELQSAKHMLEMLVKHVQRKKITEKCRSVFDTCSRCQLILHRAINEETSKLYRSYIHVENCHQWFVTRLNYTKWKNLSQGIIDAEQDQVPEFAGTKFSVTKANSTGCLKCSPTKFSKANSLLYFMHLKSEFVRRQEMLRLLIGLAECQEDMPKFREVHGIFCQSISIMLGDDPFCNCHHGDPHPLELVLMTKENHGDMLCIERAEVLYSISWFSLKSLLSGSTRTSCCYLCGIQTPKILSLLKIAFVFSREVPVLLKKVSQLLAIVNIVAATQEGFSSSLSCKLSSENYWAAYYHQMSVGSYHTHSLLCSPDAKYKANGILHAESPEVREEFCSTAGEDNFLRLLPESTLLVEDCAEYFFESLPCATIVCISFLGGGYLGLLKDLLPSCSYVPWMLVSRVNAKSQPVVMLIPLDSPLKDDEASLICSTLLEGKSIKQWSCPWGSSVVDEIAPVFKSVLRHNYISSAHFPTEDTKENRENWWRQRAQLDGYLSNLVRDMEQSWFGPWKYLLLGQLLDSSPITAGMKQLIRHLKIKSKSNVNGSLVEVILEGVRSYNWGKDSIKSLLEKGCYVGNVSHCDKDRWQELYNLSDGASVDISTLVDELNNIEKHFGVAVDKKMKREQIILVLDNDVQMLPWESMPILREEEQEIYRMPSVSCIYALLQRSVKHQEEAQSLQAIFPLIDPLDAFYLLNPSGDLNNTQVEFEEWFKSEQLQGKAGVIPTTEELSAALRNHDMYLYFGHGSGAQYIPLNEIQKLENCAAAALMGCSSGSVVLNGSYTPQCTAYSYLLAGSPVVVANLWEVTDKDIDRFGKALLKAWIVERSASSTKCFNCRLLAEAFESMDFNDGTKSTRSAPGKKKKLIEDGSDSTCPNCSRPKHKVGYFISKAREMCRLKYLTGAAPVCYGVPTGITRKKD